MLGKIVLTAAVILIAVLFIRQQRLNEANADKSPRKDAEKDSGTSDLRFAAYAFLAMMLGLGAFVYYQSWRDDHTILTINLYRDGNSAPISYEVYKYQLASRSFVTLEGVQITVADNERMEIIGLD